MGDGIDGMRVVYLLLVLAMVGGSLAGHRLSWSKGLVMALAWAAIFGGLAWLVTTFGGV